MVLFFEHWRDTGGKRRCTLADLSPGYNLLLLVHSDSPTKHRSTISFVITLYAADKPRFAIPNRRLSAVHGVPQSLRAIELKFKPLFHYLLILCSVVTDRQPDRQTIESLQSNCKVIFCLVYLGSFIQMAWVVFARNSWMDNLNRMELASEALPYLAGIVGE